MALWHFWGGGHLTYAQHHKFLRPAHRHGLKVLLRLNSVPQLCLFAHGYGKYVGLATRWLSPNPGNRGLKNTSRNPNFKRRLAVFEVGRVGVHGPQWVARAFVQVPERYVHIVCVCVWEVDGEERGVPADAVSHLLDKSLICVTQRGIMGFWEEESGTLNAPFKPDTLCWILSSTMEGFVLNTSYLIYKMIEREFKWENAKFLPRSCRAARARVLADIAVRNIFLRAVWSDLLVSRC